MKQINLVNTIVVLSLTLIALLMVYKAYFAFNDMRYLIYGYDAPRTMSYAQTLFQRGVLSTDIPPRYGLIVYAAITGTLVNALPSQLFHIPFWTINGASVLIVFFMAKKLYRSSLFALLASFAFVSLSIPNHVTDANFYAFVISPLRFLALVQWLRSSRIISGWGAFYIFMSFSGQFTYPIFHIMANSVLLILLPYLASGKAANNIKIAVTLGVNTLFRLLAFFVTAQLTQSFHSPHDVLNRIYVFWIAPISIKQGALFILTLSLIEVLTIIWLLKRPKSNLKQSIMHAAMIVLAPFQSMVRWLMVIGFVSLLVPAMKAISSSERGLFLHVMAISWPLVISAPQRYLKHRMTKFMFVGLTILMFGLLLPLPQVASEIRNIRFFQLTEVFTALLVAKIIAKSTWQVTLVLVALLIVMYPYTLSITKHTYRDKGNTVLASTMDSFYQEPHQNKILFYASYAYKPVLLPNERFQAQTFISTSIPWKNQWFMSHCRVSDVQDCYEMYKQAKEEYKATYLIIDQLPQDNDPNIKELMRLGSVVNEQGVIIVKL